MLLRLIAVFLLRMAACWPKACLVRQLVAQPKGLALYTNHVRRANDLNVYRATRFQAGPLLLPCS